MGPYSKPLRLVGHPMKYVVSESHHFNPGCSRPRAMGQGSRITGFLSLQSCCGGLSVPVLWQPQPHFQVAQECRALLANYWPCCGPGAATTDCQPPEEGALGWLLTVMCFGLVLERPLTVNIQTLCFRVGLCQHPG